MSAAGGDDAPRPGRPRIERLGEDALLLRFGSRIDASVNRQVHALAAAIERDRPAWLREVVPAYASLALQVADNAPSGDPLAQAERWLHGMLQRGGADAPAPGPLPPCEIPVAYGGAHGPDLDDVARHCGLSPDEVVARHGAGDYTVAMLGFAPGFPYLTGLDPSLATPRLPTPRTRVPAGSVGIGGAQAGVYPRAGPGGWRLIGRTPLALFDASREPPCLLAPGRMVRFVSIDEAAFAALAGDPAGDPR